MHSALKVFVKMLNGGSEHPQEVTQTSIARCARVSACDIHHATPFYDIGTNTLVSTTIVVSPYPGYPCLPPRRVHVRDWPPSQLRGGGNGGEGPSTTTPCGPLTLPCTVDWSGGDDSGISIAPTKLGEVRDLLSGALFLPLFEGLRKEGPVYRLSMEPQDCDREGDAPWQHPRVTLQAFPGGHETFELVVRFCYTDDGRGVSHENRNAVLFGEEPVVVASLADGGTTIWDTSAATTASNAPVESMSGIMRWHCFTTSATACHSQCSISRRPRQRRH